MTVDVEDYFQVSAFAAHIRREDWASYPCRVEQNTDALLELFAEYGVRATFFTLGWVADRYPRLVRRIVDGGHELASHGFAHFRVREQAPDVFRADVRRTKRLLEDVGGVPVAGYRAASFSIGEDTLWAFDVLAEEGHAYSSSIYPIHHDHYGMPEAPRFAYRPRGGHGILEVPISTVDFMNRKLPCGGGGYFRLLPYGLSVWALRRINRTDGQPCVFYFHPWEIDPGQPRQGGVSLRTRIRHYVNLGRMEPRLRALLAHFAWDRMDRVFLNDVPPPAGVEA
jgi:polysaccharide deacetylase family protein (PEP-CTERM system associated)